MTTYMFRRAAHGTYNAVVEADSPEAALAKVKEDPGGGDIVWVFDQKDIDMGELQPDFVDQNEAWYHDMYNGTVAKLDTTPREE